MDYTAVSQGVRRFENSIKEDDKIRKELESVLELLNSMNVKGEDLIPSLIQKICP